MTFDGLEGWRTTEASLITVISESLQVMEFPRKIAVNPVAAPGTNARNLSQLRMMELPMSIPVKCTSDLMITWWNHGQSITCSNGNNDLMVSPYNQSDDKSKTESDKDHTTKFSLSTTAVWRHPGNGRCVTKNHWGWNWRLLEMTDIFLYPSYNR